MDLRSDIYYTILAKFIQIIVLINNILKRLWKKKYLILLNIVKLLTLI